MDRVRCLLVILFLLVLIFIFIIIIFSSGGRGGEHGEHSILKQFLKNKKKGEVKSRWLGTGQNREVTGGATKYMKERDKREK